MSDRRRAPRHVLSTPLPSDVMLIEDVTVERFVGDRLSVTSSTAYRTGDAVTVRLMKSETPSSLTATVISNRTVLVDGTLCFRIELRIDAPSAGETEHQ